jgi:hypothetical protein
MYVSTYSHMLVRPDIIEICDIISRSAVTPGASWRYSRHIAEPLFLKTLIYHVFALRETLGKECGSGRRSTHSAPTLDIGGSVSIASKCGMDGGQ